MDGTIRLEAGGRLSIREEGPRVRFSAGRPDDGQGLYKLWLWGPSGRLLLGTMVPEQGQLRLERTMSRQSLERSGCWPVAGAAAELAFSFARESAPWRSEPHPEQLLDEPLLRECARRCAPLLLQRSENGFLLAARYDPDRPFPIAPLFCLSHLEQIDGLPHILFHFDARGHPILPPGGVVPERGL